MRFRRIIGSAVAAATVSAMVGIVSGPVVASASPQTLGGTMIYLGTTTPKSVGAGGASFALPELPPGGGEAAAVNRSLSSQASAATLRQAPRASGRAVAARASSLNQSFQGLDHFDQRFANGGNQFSLEPPDQGLCVGHGFVMESVNDVMKVWDTSGNPLIGAVDLNTFYGYPAQFNRTTGEQGPFVTDPSCYYDPEHNRFVNVVLTLDVDPISGNFLGSNHLDVAVSMTGDPTGSWNLYSIPVQDDGTDGTPNHHCIGGPCIGDYPHIGADKFGFYITTNEYALFADQYITAQLYAMSKSILTSGAVSVPFVHMDNLFSAPGRPGFTMWPAESPAGSYATQNQGTEYFLSSMAADESGNHGGGATDISLWKLSNTRSLNSTPALTLQVRVLPSEGYSFPPDANQKVGSVPLAKCLNANCLQFGPVPTTQVEGKLDTNDSRMQQVWYANGQVFGALDTAVTLDLGRTYVAAIAWFAVDPAGSVAHQGYLAVGTNQDHLSYPAVATLADGTGVMAFTLVGANHYPTAAYAAFDPITGPGAIQVAAEGVGPQDGFSEYGDVFGSPPRWGDYGAAAIDGSTIWIGSEYIGQTCSYGHYRADFTCGGTRSALANWATRISNVTP
jgi:hypothetical protein